MALHSGRASGYAACVVLAIAVKTSSFQDRQVHNRAAGKGKQYRAQPFALVTRLDRAMAGTKKLSISELTDNHLILAACACMGASTGALSCSQVPLMLWMSATGEVVACTSLNAIERRALSWSTSSDGESGVPGSATLDGLRARNLQQTADIYHANGKWFRQHAQEAIWVCGSETEPRGGPFLRGVVPLGHLESVPYRRCIHPSAAPA